MLLASAHLNGLNRIQGVLETTATELAQSMGVSGNIVRLTMGDGA